MKRIEVVKGEYYDSVTLMLVAKELKKIEGVHDASLNMATEANITIMRAAGFEVDTGLLSPDDLLIGIDYEREGMEDIFERARSYLASPPWKKEEKDTEYSPATLQGALSVLPESNLALISLPGRYAAAEAMKALKNGLNVMLYSDNVTIEDEIELKRFAENNDLIVMGPDCGTAVINGKGLAFSNVCPTGPVGIVAASGTGLQEVMVQLCRRDVGVKHGIGTGGRDVKKSVGGISFLRGIRELAKDPDISLIVAIGKPPAPEVREKILACLKETQKKSVICFMGDDPRKDEDKLFYTTELEECAVVAEALIKGRDVSMARDKLKAEYVKLAEKRSVSAVHGKYVRGLFTGGTLCYEAQYIAQAHINPIYGNAPLREDLKLENSLKPIGHSFIDYGEDEFTQGRLHPMIDPSFRAEQVKQQSEDRSVAVILFDVVLGYGSADNPSFDVVEAIKSVNRETKPIYIAYVCGTDGDPQDLGRQRALLEEAGVIVCESNARAALLAASLVSRKER